MNQEKYLNILQKYEKLEKFDNNLSKNLQLDDVKYCISLSGGVDSMVLMDILYKQNKEIIAVHINYNNREESNIEEDFLRNYCNNKNIKFICHSLNIKRGTINRNLYETLTKKIKFKLYKSILAEYNLNFILLGHHKDDIIENIFSNFCKGENFLNLSVIKYSNTIMDVNIVRPLIYNYKTEIYNYAHHFEIPYFLDTTPDWSVRGKFRNIILHNLLDTFPSFKKNLLNIASQSEEWSTLIQTNFIDKYLKLIKFDNFMIESPLVYEGEDYREYPICFWNIIIAKIFHRFGISAPSKRSLDIFMISLKNKKNIKVLLKYGTKLIILNETIQILFTSS